MFYVKRRDNSWRSANIPLIRHRSPIGNIEEITRFFEFLTKPFQFCFKYLGFRKRGEKVRAHVSQALIYDKIMDM